MNDDELDKLFDIEDDKAKEDALPIRRRQSLRSPQKRKWKKS